MFRIVASHLLGVVCFVKHVSYPKYAWSQPTSKLKTEGAAMDVAKNILLFLSNTHNKSPNCYANEGRTIITLHWADSTRPF